ncbi:MAG: hypothetical protein ACLTBP_08510 [Frisingicoccus sp.]
MNSDFSNLSLYIDYLNDFKDINTVFKNAGISKESAQSILQQSKRWKNSLSNLSESSSTSSGFITNEAIALEGLKSSESALAAIGTTLKATLTNPLTWMAGAGIAAVGALIYKATEFDRAVNASAKSQSVFASAANELSELNSQMDAVSARISELQTLKQQQKISPAESTELNLLMLQNSELEHQIQLKEKSASQLSDIAVNDTLRALNQKNTIDLVPTENSENGSDTKKVYDDFGTAYYAYDKTDIITATEKEIEKLEDLKETKANLMAEIKNPLTGSERKAEAEKELQDTEAEITKLTHNVTDQIQDLQVLYEGLRDPVTGLMKEGMSAEAQIAYQSMTDIFSTFNTLDLTGAEAELAKLDNFFNGSSGRNYIKDALMAASDAGENLEDALRGMGLSLENLGIDNVDTLKQYLDDAKTSAEAAAQSVDAIDGSLESVQNAFAKANKGNDWSSMTGYIEQANELYKQGLIGTDDFQSVAQLISPEKIDISDGEGGSLRKPGKMLMKGRWFDTETPDESIMNFARDLDAGAERWKSDDSLVSINEDGGRFKVDSNSNPQPKPQELGTRVEVVEALLHKFEDYGYEFDDILFSGEGLDAYKQSLEGIRTLFDSLSDGTSKERLGGLLEQWDSDYAYFLEHPEELDNEQILKLQFEYDMASLESEIDHLQELWNEGYRSAEIGASLNTSKRAYREEREKNTGYDENDDAGYRAASDKIEELQSQFNSNQSDADRESIQSQISAILDLQNAFQDAFSDGEAVDWESFLNSEQAMSVMEDIMNSTNLSKEDLENLLNIDFDTLASNEPVIKVTAEADVSTIEAQVSGMEIGETLTFNADISGVQQEIEAIKNEDGTISYFTEIDGTRTQFELNKNGTITYIVNEVPGTEVDTSDSVCELTVNEVPGETVQTVPVATSTANFNLGSYPTSLPPIYQTVYQVPFKLSSGEGTLATGTLLSPAHADGKVSLPQNETALVNELGTESIIRNGKWMLIPGGMHREHLKKGDIILNANQTKSLMKYGKAAGKGRAYADGTLNSVLSNAYASGSGDTPEPETFDWIENRIKHLESLTEDWKKKLESVTTFKAQNSYISQIILAIQNEISNLNESYNAYMAKAASLGLSSDYVQKIQSGQLVIEDITDEDLQEKIKDYQDWYDKAEDCRKSIEDLKLDVKDLNEEQVDNITNDFGNLSSLFKTIIGHYETLNQLAEKQGKFLGRTDYDALIKYNNELKAVKSEELKNMQAEFDRLMKTQEGFAGSDLYMDMQEHIFSLKDDIASINIELEDIKDNIVESDFSAFKKNEAHLKSFADELDRIGDLLNENNFFNDNGSFTSVGYTKIALISEQITTARQLMAEYENAIDQLGKHLSKGNISQEEYNESLEEYREGAQNAAADVKRYKEAILDLVKDGLKQELDTNKELISARKEALKGLKDYDNYQKKIEDKNKDIQQLQAQLAALEGQTGQNVDRQRRELQAKLRELEADKQELMDDRSYDLRMEGYDKAQDDLQERFNAYIKDLESNTRTQEKVIGNTLKNVRDNYGSVAGELNKIGVDMSEDIAKPWLSAKNAAKQYTDAMKDAAAKSTIVTDKIDTSKRENQSVIQSIAPKPAEKEYKVPPAETPQQPAAPSGPKSPNDLGLDPSPSTKGLSWLLKEVSIHDRLLYNGWATSDRNYQLLHEWAGGQGSWTGTAEQNIHILNALKAAGFSHGGILQATGEDGIFLGRNKEAVLTETQWNTIRDLADTAPVLVHALPQFSAPQSPDTVTNVFDAPLIQVEGKADEYTVRELRQLARSIAPMIGKEFYKDARKIGLK